MSKKTHLYIISNYKFRKHKALKTAQRERERLQALFPECVFRIYKVERGILKTGENAPEQKADPSSDYKNPSSQKGPIKLKKPKISLANFKGEILTQQASA